MTTSSLRSMLATPGSSLRLFAAALTATVLGGCLASADEPLDSGYGTDSGVTSTTRRPRRTG